MRALDWWCPINAAVPAGEDDLLSKFVNVLIRTKPLYAGMKVLAKRTLKRTAEGRGVPWEQNMQQLMSRLQVRDAEPV